jgi:hypothetical protein
MQIWGMRPAPGEAGGAQREVRQGALRQ